MNVHEDDSAKPSLWWLAAPWFLVISLILADSFLFSGDGPTGATTETTAPKARSRALLVIIDGLRDKALQDHMPHTLAISRGEYGSHRLVKTCEVNFTIPCIQTLLEGRESPFSAGLHNFSGKAGNANSLVHSAASRGYDISLISDYTLGTLYGAQATHSFNMERRGLIVPERDFDGIRRAHKQLQDGSELVILHIVATDWLAHHKKPGSAPYIEHYTKIDAALTSLYALLDPARDHLMVTGDHGHTDDGHHARESVAVLRSPIYQELISHIPKGRIPQVELTYLLAAALDIPIPQGYEGRYIGVEAGVQRPDIPPSQAFSTFIAGVRRDIGARAEEPVADAITRRRRAKRLRPLQDLLQRSPLFVLFWCWILWTWAALQGVQTGDYRRQCAGVAAGLVTTFLLGGVAPFWLMGGVAVAIAVAFGWRHVRAWPAPGRAWTAMITGVVSLSAGSAFLGYQWTAFFHSHGSFRYQTVLFFVLALAASAAGAALVSRRFAQRATLTTGLYFLFCLPAGVYFYQLGPNLARGTLIAVGLGVLGAALDAERRAHMIARLRSWRGVAGVALGLWMSWVLLQQNSGGWKWNFHLTRTFDYTQPHWFWLWYALASAWLLAMVRRARVPLALSLVGAFWYSHRFAEFSQGVIVSALVPALWLSGVLLALSCEEETQAPAYAAPREGLLVFAMSVMSLYIMMKGFFWSTSSTCSRSRTWSGCR